MSYILARKKTMLCLAILIALSLILMVGALLVGSAGSTVGEILTALTSGESSPLKTILTKVRMPRIVLSYVVGAALAVAGCAMQGFFRNPMADASVLGVSSGSALGATLAMVTTLPALLKQGMLGVLAFGGGLAAAFLVYGLSRVKGRSTVIGLLLSGVAVSALLSACSSALMILNRNMLERVVLWTMGSFTTATWSSLLWCLPSILIGAVGCMTYARDLNAMLLGDEEARLLGVRVARSRGWLMVFSALAVSGAVSVSGSIGFIGLMVPHAMRFIVGPDHRVLLPASLLAGGIFLLLMDTLARTVAAPIELPVGLLTSLCGGPFFLILLRRQQRGAE